MEYEKPKLIELDAKVGSGPAACLVGSGASSSCGGGSGYDANNCSDGGIPSGGCYAGSEDIGGS